MNVREPLNNPLVILRVAKRSRRIHTPYGSCDFAQDDKQWMLKLFRGSLGYSKCDS